MLFPHLLLFPISACNMTLPAVRVSSVRPKANYLSGTPHFCSPCFLFLVTSSSPNSLHVTNQSVFLGTGYMLWERSLKQIQYPSLADLPLSYSVRKGETSLPVHLFITKNKSFSFGHLYLFCQETGNEDFCTTM